MRSRAPAPSRPCRCCPALVLITAIYLVRAVAFAPAMHAMGQPMTPFVVWSSLICLGFGIVHLIGLVQRWPAL
ncbi:hypothetical protein [Massilia sp. Dwa41.01b]|uniref:hypothetical protein n=1 Tax=Massilia sp. Dwa41.01b TaxID=2709302 RepID=UPI001E38C3A9|nr:hypothetical protein [Massilia sp. Dwa41.01b]